MKEHQTVPFVAGLILVPIGGIIGVLAIAAAALTIMLATKAAVGDPLDVVILLGLYAFVYGCLAAVPITLFALPASYFVLRRKSGLAVRKFVLAGFACAILEACALLVWWWLSNEDFRGLATFLVLIAVVLIVTGLLAGFAFAHLTRLVRPGDWTQHPGAIPP